VGYFYGVVGSFLGGSGRRSMIANKLAWMPKIIVEILFYRKKVALLYYNIFLTDTPILSGLC